MYAIAFKILGNKIDLFLPHVEELRRALQSANIKVSFKAYVCAMILFSIIAYAIAQPISFTLIYLMLTRDLIKSILISFGLSLTIGFAVFWTFYLYPYYVIGNRRRAIDTAMPYTVSYMAVLAMAGMPLPEIFKSLAKVQAPKEVSDEAKDIVRDIELFGYDVLTALEKAAEKTPSTYFAEVLRGIATITKIGGNLRKYLLDEANRFIRIRRAVIRRVNATLLSMAEMYIVASIVMPMLFIVLSAIMAFLGGQVFGIGANIVALIATYVFIPSIFLSFLIIVDAFLPED